MINTSGWCIQAVCDRCRFTAYMPHSSRKTPEEQLARDGWSVGETVMCPACAARHALAEQAKTERERKRRKRERRLWPWRK